MILHGYWRSSATYRVRIALGLKGLTAEAVGHDLRLNAQHDPAYLARNPQGLVPAIETDDGVVGQSLAILEWLDETHPEPPLLPAGAFARAQVRAMAQVVACDTHPLQNLRVLKRLKTEYGFDDAATHAWARGWITPGLAALEALVQRHGAGFSFGDQPTLADCCLIPQLYNARRFETPLDAYPALLSVEANALSHPAIAAAHPDRQPDAG
ncbi:MAG: maleylacetoacetate isomerase [Brevundimonas sp.]|nr:MAG: maleylacetoacetate isomerase [Brevundimonas sp.]